MVKVDAGGLHNGDQVRQQLLCGDLPHPFQGADDPQHGLVQGFLGPVGVIQYLLGAAQQEIPVALVQPGNKLPVGVIFDSHDKKRQHDVFSFGSFFRKSGAEGAEGFLPYTLYNRSRPAFVTRFLTFF